MLVLLIGGIKLIFVFILTFYFDHLFQYYLPFLPTYFTYFQPFLFVSSVIVYLILFYSKKKIVYTIFLCGLLYDLFFGSVPFFYFCLFLFFYLEIAFIQDRINSYVFTDFVLFIISLISFFLARYFILGEIYQNVPSFSFFFLQILHYLPLNLLFGIIFYFFLGIKHKKA